MAIVLFRTLASKYSCIFVGLYGFFTIVNRILNFSIEIQQIEEKFIFILVIGVEFVIVSN